MTTAKIRQLNDQLRASLGLLQPDLGRVVYTTAVAALGAEVCIEIFKRVQQFNDFTLANDVHGEHDFGAFELEGRKIFWQIDYYDLPHQYGAEEPSDPDTCQRVLTIMLAEEY